MRIEQFEYLVDIYKTKSITRTAENFFISRQVVSHAIHSLEDEIGVQLLNREQGEMRFTTIGEIAVNGAQKIIDAYGEFLGAVSGFHVGETTIKENSTITILAVPRLASTIVPSVIATYKKQDPGVEFSIMTKSSKEILDMLPNYDNAIGLISYPDHIHSDMEAFRLANYPNLMVYPFIESQFYICMNKSSKYNTKTAFDSNDLQQLPLLSYEPVYSLLGSGEQSPLDLNIRSRVNDIQALCALIKQDMGVGLITLNEYNSLVNNKNLILRPIKSNRNCNIYFAYVLTEFVQNNSHLKKIASILDTILKQ